MFKKTLIPLVILVIIAGGILYVRRSFSPGERQDLIEEVEAMMPTLPVRKATSTAKNTTATTTAVTKKIEHAVPFTSQAPLFQWEDGRFQDGCEEASALMAIAWARGTKLGGAQAVTAEIIKMVEFQEKAPGGYQPDLSTHDTYELIKNYFNYSKVSFHENVTANDVIRELAAGNVIVAPVNGRALNNPYFTPPGPLYHMLVIVGYNPATKEFITNDPGTRLGAKFRYPVATFMKALRDYPTGHHEPILGDLKRMVVVSK
jgi:hypothetical protein